jgi:tRNA pseudouridine55 synthase
MTISLPIQTPTEPAHCGILLLDKPLGLSSSGATQRVRRLLGGIRAGHIGSLDPLATGMLPICLGEATKIAGVVLDGHKCYSFTIALGARTSTGDTEGEVVQTAAVPVIDATAIDAVLKRFLGAQQQLPPMYSAIKQQGQPLYKLARAGLVVERAARRIEIFQLECVALQVDQAGGTRLACRVLCGKGTYVRTLAEDIAVALGTVGHVIALRRDWVAPFDTLPMCGLEALQSQLAAGLPPPLIGIGAALPGLARIRLDAISSARLLQGQRLISPGGVHGQLLVEDPEGRLLGLAQCNDDGVLRPKRLFTVPI